MALDSPAYTSIDNLETVFGADFVEEYSDHDDSGARDDTSVEWAINSAKGEMDFFLFERYNASDISSNRLVITWCTKLAGYFLASQRGNEPPAWLTSEAERIWNGLEQILARNRDLPGASEASDRRPTMSNRIIDRRYRQRTVRVTRQNSTDSPSVLRRDFSQSFPGSLE